MMTSGLGLGDAYDATIQRIKTQGGDRGRLGMEALMWILHSERPLNVDEICHALATEIGSTSININNVPSVRTVLGCCQGLIAVDKGSSNIRLIHFTLKEYLSHHANLFDRPHSTIAETCLTYLNFQVIKDLSVVPSLDPRGTPLLDYASLYWGIHMRMELSDRSRYLALDLLDQYENQISAKLLWMSRIKWSFRSHMPFSALHCISYFGIAEVAMDLIRAKRWDVNQRDSVGLTPLMWAARHGREEVVKLLLQQKDTQPDITETESGRTALSWAAGSGHEGVVRLFLGRLCAHPESTGRRWEKTRQLVSVLFRWKYINPDKRDHHGKTPLMWAAEYGHDSVVKLLLGRKDVSHDGSDNDGRTPLSWAAEYGRDGIVKLLLEQEDVSPDKPDNDGTTPLAWAAINERDGVVKLLLELEDVSPNKPDNHDQTPLAWAAMYGHDRVVKLLLGREGVSPDRQDKFGLTPLLWAASNGLNGVVKILLGREDVSPDGPDNDGITPLLWAVMYGHDEVVRLLLERGDVSPDRPDNDGITPRLWAAEYGHDKIVKLLFRQEDICFNRRNNSLRLISHKTTSVGRMGWGGDSSSKGLHPPAWCKSLEVPTLGAFEPSHAPFYKICRWIIPDLPSHPHSTSQGEVTPQTPPFVSTGNAR